MSKKILITEKQKRDFNEMLRSLRLIAQGYQSSDQLRRNAEKEYGLSSSELIEYAYDNVQNEAKNSIKGVSFIQ